MKVAVIGSTGSVGVQALGVIRKLGRFSVSALIAYSNESLLAFQAKEFRPEVTGLISRDADCVKRADNLSSVDNIRDRMRKENRRREQGKSRLRRKADK